MAERGLLAGDRATTGLGLAVIAASAAGVLLADGYTLLIIALVMLTATVCYGLNILLGLAGLVSLGHVAFYAIGRVRGRNCAPRRLELLARLAGGRPLRGCLRGDPRSPGAPCPRTVSGDGHDRVRVHRRARSDGVERPDGRCERVDRHHAAIPRSIVFAEREMAWLSAALAACALLTFLAVKRSRLGRWMIASRDAEDAAQSSGIRPVPVRGMAFALSAAFAGLAGAVFAPLMMFVSPGTFPFSQSILFLLAVVIAEPAACSARSSEPRSSTFCQSCSRALPNIGC
jgi:hypothetical protein